IVLARAYHTIVRAVSRDVSRYRLTLGQFAVMEALYHKGALPLGRVGSLLLVTAGNITYVVDQLERRGLVRRGGGMATGAWCTRRSRPRAAHSSTRSFPGTPATSRSSSTHFRP